MIKHLIILLFVIFVISPESLFAKEGEIIKSSPVLEKEDLSPVLDAFNSSVEEEAKKKLGEAELAEQGGNYQEAQRLIREAMLLETLKVDEGGISEEKLLALKEQMSSGEQKVWIKRFIKEGDRLSKLGLYDLAVDEYERVFLLEPENQKASQRIDKVRKQFLKEQHQLLMSEGKRIDEEIAQRVEFYLNQVEELLRAGDLNFAQHTVERILTLDSKNKRAKKMLKTIKAKLKKPAKQLNKN